MPRPIDRDRATRRLDGTRDIENGARPLRRRVDWPRRADRCADEACDIENPE